MKFLFYKKITKRAFSLIELSIVIVIVSILIAGALSVVTNNTMDKKVKNTNTKFNQIYEALKVYVAKNSKLPCPASILAIKATDVNYGTSVGNEGDCSGTGVYYSSDSGYLIYGMVPVQTLGLNLDMAEDDFGSKIAYIVDKRFTSPPTPTNNPTNFPFNSSPFLAVIENINSPDMPNLNPSKFVNYTSNAIVMIISYGPNKSGAFPVNSAIQNAVSSNPFEAQNSPPISTSSGSVDFFKDNRAFYKVQNSDIFDDIVFYKTRNDIVSDSGAFDLMTCAATTNEYIDFGSGANPYTWPVGKYNQVVSSDANCPDGYKQTVAKPTKRCGALGNWESCCVDYCVGNNEFVSCTGGTITTFTNAGVTRRVHTFLNSGTFRCPSNQTIDILAVGGGGGSAKESYCAGGGGGGAVIYKTNLSITGATDYSISVGDGGDGQTYEAPVISYNGGDSKFINTSNNTNIIVAKGGGGGGLSGNETTYNTTLKGQNGGSGGGGGRGTGTSSGGSTVSTNIAAGGTTNGNAGGNSGGTLVTCGAGGGGGAAGAGGNGTCGTSLEIGGNGGNGIQINIAGVTPTPYYGSGGGGGAKTAFMFGIGGSYGQIGAGGNGGSKLTSVDSSPGYEATSPVDGYGGGAGGSCGGQAAGGGSGVVIIAYPVTP